MLLPSLRPMQAKECIGSIHNYSKSLDYYEIIVVSPFDIPYHPNVVHIKENKSEGVGKAIATGFDRAQGEYIMHINDHCRAVTSLKHMVDCMRPHDNEIFLGRFFAIDVPSLGMMQNNEIEFFERDHTIMVFGRVFAQLMCMRKDKAEEIGGFFDYPYYKAWYLDPDLSLRVWKAGGRVETCNNARVLVLPEPEGDTVVPQNRKYYNEDSEAFRKRWRREFSHE